MIRHGTSDMMGWWISHEGSNWRWILGSEQLVLVVLKMCGTQAFTTFGALVLPGKWSFSFGLPKDGRSHPNSQLQRRTNMVLPGKSCPVTVQSPFLPCFPPLTQKICRIEGCSTIVCCHFSIYKWNHYTLPLKSSYLLVQSQFFSIDKHLNKHPIFSQILKKNHQYHNISGFQVKIVNICQNQSGQDQPMLIFRFLNQKVIWCHPLSSHYFLGDSPTVFSRKSPDFQGKISRVLAAKLSLCCRVDALGDQVRWTGWLGTVEENINGKRII